MFIPPVILPPVILPVVVSPGVDAPPASDPKSESAGTPPAAGIADPIGPASIVNLSSQAQLLSDAVANEFPAAIPGAPIPPSPPAFPPAVAVTETNPVASTALLTSLTNAPVISTSDPAVAAAIAAYHLGDGLLIGNSSNVEKNPPETSIDVTRIPAVEATSLNLHDSARDDPVNGITWNWMRVNPVHRKFTRR